MSDSEGISPAEGLILAKGFPGPLLLGAMLNVWFFGMFLMQLNTYWRATGTNDALIVRCMVTFVTLVLTVSAVLACYVGYDYTIKNFGDYLSLFHVTPEFGMVAVTIAILSCTVQTFFAWRMRRLTKMTWLAVIVVILAWLQLFCAVGTITAGVIMGDFRKFHILNPAVITWQVMAPITDTIICLALVRFLRNSKTGFRHTDDILSRLSLITIQTGMITAIWSLVAMALYVSPLNNNSSFILNFPLPQIYGICLMSSLNARLEWADQSRVHESDRAVHIATARGLNVTTDTSREAYHLRTVDDSWNPKYDNGDVNAAVINIRAPSGLDRDVMDEEAGYSKNNTSRVDTTSDSASAHTDFTHSKRDIEAAL